MDVFISWSGSRSKIVAEGLKKWLGQVIQSLEPWISVDIEKGKRWDAAIAGRLEKSKVGIICLTKDNINNGWILFEAGAISKTKDAHLCTLLLDLKPSDVKPPLGLFEHTSVNKDDIKKMLHTINDALRKTQDEKALDNMVLDDVFETYWPQLQDVFTKALAVKKTDEKPSRDQREILEEILEIVRRKDNQLPLRGWSTPRQWVHNTPISSILQKELEGKGATLTIKNPANEKPTINPSITIKPSK